MHGSYSITKISHNKSRSIRCEAKIFPEDIIVVDIDDLRYGGIFFDTLKIPSIKKTTDKLNFIKIFKSCFVKHGDKK